MNEFNLAYLLPAFGRALSTTCQGHVGEQNRNGPCSHRAYSLIEKMNIESHPYREMFYGW